MPDPYIVPEEISTKASATDAPVPDPSYTLPNGEVIPLSYNDSVRQGQIGVIHIIEEILKKGDMYPNRFKGIDDYISINSIGVTFGTGAKRSARALRYDLIPPIALKRLALIYTNGAVEYGVGNWSKGMDWSDTINHAIAHLFSYLNGDYNEDHLAKVAWGIFALMYFEDANIGNNDLYRWHWEKK